MRTTLLSTKDSYALLNQLHSAILSASQQP